MKRVTFCRLRRVRFRMRMSESRDDTHTGATKRSERIVVGRSITQAAGPCNIQTSCDSIYKGQK